MSSRWFHVDSGAIDEACRPMDRFGLLLILLSVAVFLFSLFWVGFSFLCILANVGEPLYLVLIFLGGGLVPMVAGALLGWFGISKRLLASRLRELHTLAHRSGRVSAEQVRVVMGSERAADKLLLRACELGVIAPAPHT